MLSLRLSPLLVWLVAMIWIYPKGFYFFPPYNFKSTWKRTFHFVFIGISRGRTCQPGKKPLITSCWELLKQIKLNQAMWNPKMLSCGQTRPDSKRPIRSASTRANQQPTLTWPNLIELVFELRGIKRLLGRKAFSLPLLLTPGKALLCFSLESRPSAQVQSSLRWGSCLKNLPQCTAFQQRCLFCPQ